jgi:hypothetical protein
MNFEKVHGWLAGQNQPDQPDPGSAGPKVHGWLAGQISRISRINGSAGSANQLDQPCCEATPNVHLAQV